jgi:hypothetical protein
MEIGRRDEVYTATAVKVTLGMALIDCLEWFSELPCHAALQFVN